MKKEVAQKLLDMLSSGVDWLQIQSQDIINQLLRWKFYTSLLAIFFSACVLIGVVIIGARKVIPEINKPLSQQDDGWLISGIIFCLAFGLLSSVGFFVNVFQLVEIICAPKIFLLEYLHSLL